MNAHAVVIFVTLFETAENGNRILWSGLFNEHCLEAALEGLIFFKILLILLQRSGPDTAKLATRQGGLENVGGIHSPFTLTSPYKGVDFVDKEDDTAVCFSNFIYHALQSFFKFTLILGSSYERPHIEGVEVLILQIFGHIAAHNALCDTLNYGCFTRPRFPDKNGIVFCTTAQNLKHTAYFIIAPNDGIQLSATSFFYKVAGIFFKGLIGIFACG